MNSTQRKELKRVHGELHNLIGDIQCVIDEENDKIENAPENLLYSERYETMRETVEDMEDTIQELENAIYILEEKV